MSHCDPAVAPPDPASVGVSPVAPRSTDAVMTVALVGRPNAGKSSLFNQLTGSDAHVGNFPGITVEVLEAHTTLPDGAAIRFVDLPGTYTLQQNDDAETDEAVTRSFLVREPRPSLVLQVIDATQLALGLRLTREVIALRLPVLLVITQIDLLHRDGVILDAVALERALGLPVCIVSAREQTCRETVLRAVQTALAAQLIPSHRVLEQEPDAIAQGVLHTEKSAAPSRQTQAKRTEWIDAILLHPVVGPVAFVLVMTLLFSAVYSIADPVTSVMDLLTHKLGGAIRGRFGDTITTSLFVDGLLGGAGTVLAFLPQIVVLTVAMDLLEASGYLSRGAFLVDRLLRAVGLGGRSFVPLLTAHACAVPAITATRIIRDPGERLRTLLVLPLMTCSARLPTYTLLISTFFGHRSAWFRAGLFVSLYFSGILFGLIAALVLQKTVKRGRSLPLVLEMPTYRAPETRVVLRTAQRAATRFVREVGSVIAGVSVILWILLNVPMPWVAQPSVQPNLPAASVRLERSVAAHVGRAMEPVTRPMGFDWRINVGLVASFGARELMVGTMGVIFGMEDADENSDSLATALRTARAENGTPRYGTANALALMAFFVLACQCMSTVAAIRRETRTWRWPVFVMIYTYVLAFIAAFVVYNLAK